MKTVFLPDEKINNETVVILGDFDAVHIAHRELIGEGVKYAKEHNLISLVYTFEKSIKKNETVTDNSEKEELFDKLSVDVVVFQKTDKDFFNMSCERFAEDILINSLNAKMVFVGENYTFGKNKSGDSKKLAELLKKYGVSCSALKLRKYENQVVSTTRIRNLIKNGEIESANRLLGRNFSVKGKIIEGNHLGRTIGYPTVNIKIDERKIIPRFGVYKADVFIDDEKYCAMVNIGVKPTVGSKDILLEAYIFDFDKEIYGKNIKVELLKYIREEKKFSSVEKLKEQLIIDEKEVKNNLL